MLVLDELGYTLSASAVCQPDYLPVRVFFAGADGREGFKVEGMFLVFQTPGRYAEYRKTVERCKGYAAFHCFSRAARAGKTLSR